MLVSDVWCWFTVSYANLRHLPKVISEFKESMVYIHTYVHTYAYKVKLSICMYVLKFWTRNQTKPEHGDLHILALHVHAVCSYRHFWWWLSKTILKILPEQQFLRSVERHWIQWKIDSFESICSRKNGFLWIILPFNFSKSTSVPRFYDVFLIHKRVEWTSKLLYDEISQIYVISYIKWRLVISTPFYIELCAANGIWYIVLLLRVCVSFLWCCKRRVQR